jgi:hypothetical protein
MMNEQKVKRLIRYPIIESIAFILIIGFIVSTWAMYDKPDPKSMELYKKHEERSLAAGAVKDTILTATSIILAATALIVSLSKNADKTNYAVKIHYKYVAIYSLSSIILGALNMAYIPSLINTHNIAFYPIVLVIAATQFILMVFAAMRLLCAIVRSV